MKIFLNNRLIIYPLLIILLVSCSHETKPPNESKSSNEAASGTELSSFTTSIIDTSSGRMTNLKLAVSELNGKILKPNEEFSFNKTVGPRTKERGYQKAIILIGKRKGYAEGGGVCQLSSTIYNAALNAGMQIIERHDHAKGVPYIEKGNDAAVSYGSIDFRFRNSKSYSVKIIASIDNEKTVTFKIVIA